MANMIPLIKSGGFFASRYWTPLVIGNGLTTTGGDTPDPPVQKTVSGSIVHITDALAAPAIALSTAINPAQNLHGYSNPWPAGGGKNLLQLSGRTAITSGSHGTARDFSAPFAYIGITRNNYFNNSRINSYSITDDSVTVNIAQSGYGVGLNVGVSAETTYTISYNNKTTEYIGLGYFDANGEYLSNKQFYGVGTWSFTTPANCVNLMVVFSPASNTNVDVTYNDVQLELGSSETSFAPYSNICTISGYTEANIVVSPTTTAGDGTTYTVSFGSTVYGGTLDVVNGTLTVTHGQIASYAGETLPGAWISDRDAYAAGTTPTTGAQVVYELATPQTVTLTPTEVQLLLGTNNVWSDTNGNVTLTYLADGNVSASSALNMLLGGTYTPSADVSDREALNIIMGETT